MGSSARVTSVEELEVFAASLATFAEQVQDSLLIVDMEVRRFVDWIQREHPRQLHQAHVRSIDEVAEARQALARKKLSKVDEREPDTTQEEDDLRRAKRKQERLEEMMAATKRWGANIERSVDEYRGSARPLAQIIEGDPPEMVAFVRRAIANLEAYLAVNAPETGRSIASEMDAKQSSAARPTEDGESSAHESTAEELAETNEEEST